MCSPDRESGRRREADGLGSVELAADAWHGVHAARALENLPLARRPVHPALIRAFGTVKLACAQTKRELGAWQDTPERADAIERACRGMADGRLTEAVPVDALQGGAGTSTNMAVNEVLANRARGSTPSRGRWCSCRRSSRARSRRSRTWSSRAARRCRRRF